MTSIRSNYEKGSAILIFSDVENDLNLIQSA